MRISNLLAVIRCPDCTQQLTIDTGHIHCQNCGRKIYKNRNFVDLLPSKPRELHGAFSQRAVRYYYSQFAVPPDRKYNQPKAWGSLDQAAKSYKVFTKQEYSIFQKKFPKKRDIFCDISAASGVHSFPACEDFKSVLHCDINIEYLQYARQKAQEKQLKNIWFLRTDYLQLPFNVASISMIISTDSLIYYGPTYDLAVITQLHKTLETGGIACFDVHARKWYYPDRYIFEYTKADLPKMTLDNASIAWEEFGRVPVLLTPHPWLFSASQFLSSLPPIRYIGNIFK